MVLTEGDLARAEAEMAKMRNATATGVSARYYRRTGRIVIRLNSGFEVAFSPHDAPGLESAKRPI
jgi:hypothetical protein